MVCGHYRENKLFCSINIGSGMTKTLPTAVLLTVLLGACANLDVDRSADNFDETAYASDLSECRGGPAALFALHRLESAVIGSAYGLVHGLRIGARAGDAGEGAVIGAILGGMVGLGYGAHDSIDRHDEALAQCLRDKGYATDPV